jgi:hypothetical protein
MQKSKLILSLTVIAGAVAQTALAQPPSATLPPPTFTRNSSFPPVGLAASETMQVNVANLAENPATVTSTSPAASCTGSISFFNAAGTPIGTATSFTVTAGETQSVTMTLAKAGITGTTRAEIRAVIRSTVTEGRDAPPCSLASSLETFDTTLGVTHVYLTGPTAQYSVGPVAIVLTGAPPQNP